MIETTKWCVYKRWLMLLVVGLMVLTSTSAIAQSRSDETTTTTTVPNDPDDLQFAGEVFSPAEIAEARSYVPLDENGNPVELSEAQLAALPRRVRTVLQTPVRAEIPIGGPGPADPHTAWYAAPSGRAFWTGSSSAIQHCNSPEYSQEIMGALDVVLMTASIRFHGICTRDGTFVGSPGVSYSADGNWGYSFCGWDAEYDGHRHDRSPTFPAFSAGGKAEFSVSVPIKGNLCDTINIFTITVKLWAYTYERGAWLQYHYWRSDSASPSFSFG